MFVTSLALSADERLLVTAGPKFSDKDAGDFACRVWDLTSHQLVCGACAMTAAGDCVATASTDKKARVLALRP
eukprot:gene3079-6051_t